MTHEQAWPHLPDLLVDRDDHSLLSHVATCHSCQQQVFRLNRVDRVLRTAAAKRRGSHSRKRIPVAIIAIAAAIVVIVPTWRVEPSVRVLHNGVGATVGRATLFGSKPNSLDISLELHGVKMTGGDTYVVWTQSAESPQPVPVGRLMVDASGSCRAHFTVPGRSSWTRLWVTPPSRPTLVVATT